MAYETVAVVQAAVTSIYNSVAQRKTLPRGRSAVAALNEIRQAIVEAYVVDVDVLVTDTTDASPTAAFVIGGEVGAAFGRQAVAGDLFSTSGGTADFTDNALATAKGGAVASGDRFEVLSATTVAFIGTSTDVEMDNESVADFAVKAGN